MNETVAKHYMEMPVIDDRLKETLCDISPENVFCLLNSQVKDWTYEIQSEKYLEGNAYHVTIILWLPGVVRTGVGQIRMHPDKEYRSEAIKIAVVNALKALQVKVVDKVVWAEDKKQISKAVNCNNNVESKTQVSEDTPAIDHSNEPRKSRYSQNQIDRINKFKDEYQIDTDEKLIKYLQAWDPKIKAKNELTPDNIDLFLTWINKLNDSML